MRKIVVIILVLVLTVGGTSIINQPAGEAPAEEEEVDASESEESMETQTGEQPESTESVDRESLIPDTAVKVSPEDDPYHPVLHSILYEEPVPVPYPISTAGAEDSPFITPDGGTLFFFFTPDPSVPAEEQLFDGVTGIYYSRRTMDGWGEVRRLQLSEGGLALDGCPFVADDEIWFCSAREGNIRPIDFWIAELSDGDATDIRNAGERLNAEVGVGELHITSDGEEIYFHSDAPGGRGGRDIWVTRRVDGEWQDPENVWEVNSEGSDSLPFVTGDGGELWFTRWHRGYPAIYRSRWVDGGWSEPELVVSQFAAEPTLDSEGNLYFCHHFIQDGVMLEADIYVAYRKEPLEPADSPTLPSRGFYMGVLPTPARDQSFEEAYLLASQSVELVPIWGKPTPFYEMHEELSGLWGEAFVGDLTRDNGMIPLIHFSFMDVGLTLKTPPGLEGATLSDPEWRLRYKESVLKAVQASKPIYLSIGNEVNRWYEKYGLGSPNGFEHFVSLYEEVYDAVKEASPGTRVFCTFSREIVSENREADLEVLGLFDTDKLDVLVFTSYPYALAGVNRPEDIPDDYYERALDLMPGKPFGFSEVVWSSLEAFGGEEGQADFLDQLTGRLTTERGIELHLLCWSWLHDLGEEDSTGLISWDGTEKAAYDVWMALSTSEK